MSADVTGMTGTAMIVVTVATITEIAETMTGGWYAPGFIQEQYLPGSHFLKISNPPKSDPPTPPEKRIYILVYNTNMGTMAEKNLEEFLDFSQLLVADTPMKRCRGINSLSLSHLCTQVKKKESKRKGRGG